MYEYIITSDNEVWSLFPFMVQFRACFYTAEQYTGRTKWASPSSMTSQGSDFRSVTSHGSDFRPVTSRGRGGTGNKRTICLWQFLRELLLNPQSHHNWIRWVDRNKGLH